MAFGEIIQELRKDKGLKQSDVAKALDIATSTYGNYETDVSEPSLESIRRLAKIFNVNVDYLLELTRNRITWKDLGDEVETESGRVPLQSFIDLIKRLDSHRCTVVLELLKDMNNATR